MDLSSVAVFIAACSKNLLTIAPQYLETMDSFLARPKTCAIALRIGFTFLLRHHT